MVLSIPPWRSIKSSSGSFSPIICQSFDKVYLKPDRIMGNNAIGFVVDVDLKKANAAA